MLSRAVRLVRPVHLCLVPLLALALAACSFSFGGGNAEFSDHGVSFEYPDDWDGLSTSMSAQTGNQQWSEAFGPDETNLVTVSAYTLNLAVGEDNIDEIQPEIETAVAQLAEQAGGGVEEAVTSATVAGLPGFRATVSVVTPEGTPVINEVTFAFDGTDEYFINCQYKEDAREQIADGCAMIKDSFEVG